MLGTTTFHDPLEQRSRCELLLNCYLFWPEINCDSSAGNRASIRMWDVEITSAALVVALMSRGFEISTNEPCQLSKFERAHLGDGSNPRGSRRAGPIQRIRSTVQRTADVTEKTTANFRLWWLGAMRMQKVIFLNWLLLFARFVPVVVARWRNFWWVNNMEIGADYSRWNARDAQFEYSTKRTNSSRRIIRKVWSVRDLNNCEKKSLFVKGIFSTI